ncbi:MAG: type II secretion system secretin GspD, partial [Bdellovibrionales bacterium]|nr:type II secretion system secretin GspD [Bdellovibrionales bacterium]
PPPGGAGAPGQTDFGTPAPTPGGGPANPRLGNTKPRDTKQRFSGANPEDITNSNFPDLIDSFDYPNAEITDVIKAISELTGKNFIVDPSVRGKITVMAPSRITVAEAWKAFLSALAINGFTVVPSGKFLKIISARNATKDSIDIYTGSYTPNTDQIITRIVQLKHISAGEFNKFLGRLTTQMGTIDPYEPTNTLIISDFGSNVERIMKIISQLDVASFDEQMAVMTIRHAKAEDIADLIDQIINKGQGKKARGGAFTTGIPRFGEPGAKASNAFSMVIPDNRTNTIIVVGNEQGIKKIRKLVQQLDYNLPADEAGGVFVYYVKYGDAEKIAQTLSGVAQAKKEQAQNAAGNSGGFPPPPPPPGFDSPSSGLSGGAGSFGGNVKVTANKDTNSLIITASRQDYQTVLAILKRIDIPRDQVYVEAMIMEMGVEDSNKIGLNYYYFTGQGVGRMGFSQQNALTNYLNPTADNGALLSFAGGNEVNITVPPGVGALAGGAGGLLGAAAGVTPSFKISSLIGFINFLRSQTNLNVIATPQILALDNEEANIEVGETIPVGASTTQGVQAGLTPTVSVQREPAYTKLKITPHISPTDETIRMSVEQSIKQLSTKQVQAKNLADSAVVTEDRNLKANIVVRHGQTAVLGGLIREREQANVTKVPFLGDIPILGWFFRSSQTEKSKLNLLLFLTPRIIRTPKEQQENTLHKLSERRDFIRNHMGGKDPNGARFDDIAKGAEAVVSKAQGGQTGLRINDDPDELRRRSQKQKKER